MAAEDGDGEGEEHAELIVTDGKDYTQLHMLQSMTDGKTELDRLYTNIMIAFGVPPQVFGKNVNTERHAASNRLTESAVARPRGSVQRPMSITADAVHFMHQRGSIQMTDSHFEAEGDDAFNVHGAFIVLRACHPARAAAVVNSPQGSLPRGSSRGSKP